MKRGRFQSFRRLLAAYLVLSGVAAHLILLALGLHFQSTGATPHRYLNKALVKLEQYGNIGRITARVARVSLIETGLVRDPLELYPPDLAIEPPKWRGSGANALRVHEAPRYSRDGRPLPSADATMAGIHRPANLRRIEIASVTELRSALSATEPGVELVLAPGKYRIDALLKIKAAGTADRPVVIRGASVDQVIIELAENSWVELEGSHAELSHLIIRGDCGVAACKRFVSVSPGARSLSMRNLFVTGVETLVEERGASISDRAGLLDGITIVDGETLSPPGAWTETRIRSIATSARDNAYLVLCPDPKSDSSCDTGDLRAAVRRIAPGGVLLMRTGEYQQAASISKPGIHILAEPGAYLFKSSTEGKGALVTNSDIIIEGLRCSHVRVSDGNGACVRQQNGDLELVGVHFHHAQMGLLTGHKGGSIRITDSYLHDSGYDESGQLGHNLYVNSGTLEFIRSWSLAARNAGHEIKSRAERTIIEDSLVASLNARDSRLIDAPDGGVLEVRRSVLGEGPRSENWDLIGFGLELRGGRLKHGRNEVWLEDNTFYLDRPDGSKLLNAEHVENIRVAGNVIVGSREPWPGNVVYKDRNAAEVGDYPDFPLLFR